MSTLQDSLVGHLQADGDTADPIEDPDDLEKLLEATRATGDRILYLLVLLQLDAGLRLGESFATRPEDMLCGQNRDDTSRLVWVGQNCPQGLSPELPKSGRQRGVPMSRRLRDFYRSEFGIRGKARALVSGSGLAQSHYARTAFPKLCKAAGLPRRTPKVLRDTFASHLLSAGFPMIQTMAWMGHAPTSVGMFRRRYAKWIGEENARSYRAPMTLLPGEVPTDVLAEISPKVGDEHLIKQRSSSLHHCVP